MPRGDRTGPDGFGPRTGRAAGYCSGYPAPGFANPGFGASGGGASYGRGRGWRNRYYATPYGPPPALPAYNLAFYGSQFPSEEEEISILKSQVKMMEEDMKAAQARLAELEEEE